MRHSSIAFALLVVLATIGALHCGTTSTTDSPRPTDSDDGAVDAGNDPQPAEDAGDVDGSAIVSGSDGGTIDLGDDAEAPASVCGGAKGDPKAVPLLDWNIVTLKSQYAVQLGVQNQFNKEPFLWIDSQKVVVGTIGRSAGTFTGATVGYGPFKTTDLNEYQFTSNVVMPKTDLTIPLLGWSQTLKIRFNLRTKLADFSRKEFLVGGAARTRSDAGWVLTNVRKTPQADDAQYAVNSIVPYRGQAWFLTILFDHPCKVTGLQEFTGDNPMYVLEPFGNHTRAEVSKFLVDNDARLLLTVVLFGSENAEVKAALNGTQASAATLDTLETTLSALTSTLDSDWVKDVPLTYEDLTNGTNPSWVIGEVRGRPIEFINPVD